MVLAACTAWDALARSEKERWAVYHYRGSHKEGDHSLKHPDKIL
jgi:hypothetical protein